ncbi:Adenylylsulfate kinase [Cynara cardunculus var. scolymus]|uniref:Adenylyl-sulfate kinase n=1 Tax=Cynara cardunculus var. scolymus TaxID=59895 RepID=A0A103Y570_CYNCS|nr:Adenylylsulfate kinase [Cynara cardunculus var. scolymus]
MIAVGNWSLIFESSLGFDFVEAQSTKVGFANFPARLLNCRTSPSKNLVPIKAKEASRMSSLKSDIEVGSNEHERGIINNSDDSNGSIRHEITTKGRRSTNIVWHKCSVEKIDRQELLQQKGCVIWITGLSGSGKSTLACALTRALHSRGKLTYVLDGDNVRHGLNRDLTFKAEDRAENIRRIGEVAKLFADAGIICIASVISPYRKDRDACRSLLPDGDFIEAGIQRVCTSLHALERLKIVLEEEGDVCPPPEVMADKVISYLEGKGYLQA